MNHEIKVIALARSDLFHLNEHLAVYYADRWRVAAVVPDGPNDTIYLHREVTTPLSAETSTMPTKPPPDTSWRRV